MFKTPHGTWPAHQDSTPYIFLFLYTIFILVFVYIFLYCTSTAPQSPAPGTGPSQVTILLRDRDNLHGAEEGAKFEPKAAAKVRYHIAISPTPYSCI
jgi:hypothetical protein